MGGLERSLSLSQLELHGQGLSDHHRSVSLPVLARLTLWGAEPHDRYGWARKLARSASERRNSSIASSARMGHMRRSASSAAGRLRARSSSSLPVRLARQSSWRPSPVDELAEVTEHDDNIDSEDEATMDPAQVANPPQPQPGRLASPPRLRRRASSRHANAVAAPVAQEVVEDAVVSEDSSQQASWSALAIGVLCVLFGGCMSFALFEVATRLEPDSRNMFTAFQFLSTAVSTFSLAHFTSKRTVPLRVHAILAALTTGGAMLANLALSYNVPTPVFLIVRNGNLVANMLVARFTVGRHATWRQVQAVVLVSAGIAMTTWSSLPAAKAEEAVSITSAEDGTKFMVGVLLLLASLFLQALCSLAQEQTFRKFGKASDEVLFFSSVLGLPALLPSVPGLGPRLLRWLQPSSVLTALPAGGGTLLPLPFAVPLSLLLVSNLFTSYLCKRGVMTLLLTTNSLTTSVTVTVYRVVSLLISLIVFNAPPAPSLAVWAGVAVVFGGSTLYMTAPSKPQTSQTSN